MTMSAESKVGFVFLLGIAAMLILTILLGNFQPFSSGIEYEVLFRDIGGLNVGDPVRMAGLEVGKVVQLQIDGDRIRATIRLRPGIYLKEGCRILVQDDTLIGGKVLSVTLPGGAVKNIDPGETLVGERAESTGDIFSEIARLSSDIHELVVSFNNNQQEFFTEINSILKRDRKKFSSSLDNFNKMGIRMQEVAESILAITRRLEEGQGTAGKLLRDDGLYVDAREIAEKIRSITTRVESGEGTLGKLVREDGLYENFDKVSRQLVELSEKLNRIADKVDRGEGALGKMINEDTFYHQAVSFLDDAEVAVKELSDISRKSRDLKVSFGVRAMNNTERDETLSSAYLLVAPSSSKFYQVGASVTSGRNIFRKDRDADVDLDLLLGRRFWNDRFTVRGGIMESRAGIGFDYQVNDKTRFSIEGRDTYESEENIKDARIRSYLEYSVLPNLSLSAGGDNLGEDAAFWVGGRFEFEDKDLRYLITTLGLGF